MGHLMGERGREKKMQFSTEKSRGGESKRDGLSEINSSQQSEGKVETSSKKKTGLKER